MSFEIRRRTRSSALASQAAASARSRASVLRAGTALAVILAVAPAYAGQFPLAVTGVADPQFANLTIPADAATRGMWSGVQTWPLITVHMSLLPTGKVASYGSPTGNNAAQDGRTYDIWDPLAGFGANAHRQFGAVGAVNSFCSTAAFLPSGAVLIAGGIIADGNDKGSALIAPDANGVQAAPGRLANDRYYSTMLTLPDGSPLIMGGSFPYQATFEDPEGSITRGLMTGMTPEVYRNGAWTSLFGAMSRDAFGPDFNRFWYPRAWVAPQGTVFGITSEKMWRIDPAGSGAVTFLANFKRAADPNTRDPLAAPNIGPTSSAVMYDVGKILQTGGNGYNNGYGSTSSRLATLIDINSPTPVVTDTFPMNFGRQWHNLTALPNGKVVAVGGAAFGDNYSNTDAVLAAEIWDPATGFWTLGASNAIYRGYHSSSLLMQNGTVLLAGGGIPGPVNNFNAEVYYPPYLFKADNGRSVLAPRLQIVSMTANRIGHGQTLQVEIDRTTTVSQAYFLALGQVTHSFGNNQRLLKAEFTQTARAIAVSAPPNPNVAPPGFYQLVLVDQAGVPSPGVIVGVGNVEAPIGTPTVPFVRDVAPAPVPSGTAGGTGPVAGTTGGTTGGSGAGGTIGTPPSGLSPFTQPQTSGATAIGGGAGRIAVGADGTTVTINRNDGSVWLYQSDTAWVKLPGQFRDIAVIKGNSLYGIANDNQVYRFDGTTWTLVGTGDNVTISAASDGTVVVVNRTGDIWSKPTDDAQMNWRHLPGAARKVVAMNGRSYWSIGIDNNVYRSDGVAGWILVGHDASDLAATADGAVVVVNSNTKQIWRKIGDNTVEAWSPIPNGLANAVAAPNAQRLITIGSDGKIYRY